MKQRLIFCTVWISLLVAAHAQLPGSFRVQQYSTENGLPSNGIKGMAWDEKTGFLWLATEAGIVRFNGLNLEVYTNENTPIITTERVLFMVQNSAGNIYAGDLAGNIIQVKDQQLIPYPFSKRAPFNAYYTHFGLTVSDTFFRFKALHPSNPVFSLLSDKIFPLTDTSCIILHSGAVFQYNMHMDAARSFPPETIKAKNGFMIGKDIFILSNQEKIFHLNPETGELLPISIGISKHPEWKVDLGGSLFFPNNTNGNQVLIRNNNAWLLKNINGRIDMELICNSVPTDALIQYAQYSEKRKLLFIGTNSKGITVISHNYVAPLKKSETNINERNAYYAQVELSNGNILTNEAHILGSSIQQPGPLPITGKFNFSTAITTDSVLWYVQVDPISHHSCLHSYNYRTRQTVIFNKIICGDQFGIILTGGKYYFAFDQGIGIIEGDSLHYIRHFPPLDTNPFIEDMLEYQPGQLIIATCGSLMQFDINSHRLDTIIRENNFCIRSLRKYHDYLFMGTYGKGIYIYKNGVMKAIPLDKNKFLLYAHCFLMDNEGFVWISTNRGLFKASLDDMINAFEKNIPQIYYHYFGRNDGMDITEMNGGCTPCALTLRNGAFSFPTMDGLLQVDPRFAIPELPTGELYIDEVIASGKKINTDSLALEELKPSTQEMVIKLGFSAWCKKENIYLEYELNQSGRWRPVDIKDNSMIHLTSLLPGIYQIRIRKLNGYGINNYSYKEIRFTISTPWYKRWWFNLLVLLATLGLIGLYLNIRTRQYKKRQQKLEEQIIEKTRELKQKNEVLEKNDQIKTRLISIISHDIVTPLKFLNLAGKNLLEKRDVMPEELQKETISEITDTSKELQLLSTNILNWIKYQNEDRRLAKERINLYEICNDVFAILQTMAKQKQIGFVNKVDEGQVIHQFFEPLKIIIYNLVLNALNFTEKGSIITGCEQTPDFITLYVQDEGVGMTDEQVNNIMADQFIISSSNVDKRKGNGLGYLIIKDLLKMLGGSLQIKTEKNKGTRVMLIIPTR